MPSLELDSSEVGNLMFILANAEGKGINWGIVNPLLMKIGEQMRIQSAGYSNISPPPPPVMKRQRENSKETGM
jgi:hypothetical protein